MSIFKASEWQQELDRVFVAEQERVAAMEAETPQKPSVLDEAKAIIAGHREEQYGKAERSFETIAELWSTYLRAELSNNPAADEDVRAALGVWDLVNAKDVAMMMTLLKIAREAHSPKRDNRVDGIGYLALADDIDSKDSAA